MIKMPFLLFGKPEPPKKPITTSNLQVVIDQDNQDNSLLMTLLQHLPVSDRTPKTRVFHILCLPTPHRHGLTVSRRFGGSGLCSQKLRHHPGTQAQKVIGDIYFCRPGWWRSLSKTKGLPRLPRKFQPSRMDLSQGKYFILYLNMNVPIELCGLAASLVHSC